MIDRSTRRKQHLVKRGSRLTSRTLIEAAGDSSAPVGQTQASSPNDPAPIASSPTTAPTTDDSADVSAASTLPYNDDDPDRTLPYDDEAPAGAADKQQFEDLFSMSHGDLHSIAAQCRMNVKDKSHL